MAIFFVASHRVTLVSYMCSSVSHISRNPPTGLRRLCSALRLTRFPSDLSLLLLRHAVMAGFALSWTSCIFSPKIICELCEPSKLFQIIYLYWQVQTPGTVWFKQDGFPRNAIRLTKLLCCQIFSSNLTVPRQTEKTHKCVIAISLHFAYTACLRLSLWTIKIL